MKDYTYANRYRSMESRLIIVHLDDDSDCISATSFYRHYFLGRINAALGYYAYFNPLT